MQLHRGRVPLAAGHVALGALECRGLREVVFAQEVQSGEVVAYNA